MQLRAAHIHMLCNPGTYSDVVHLLRMHSHFVQLQHIFILWAWYYCVLCDARTYPCSVQLQYHLELWHMCRIFMIYVVQLRHTSHVVQLRRIYIWFSTPAHILTAIYSYVVQVRHICFLCSSNIHHTYPQIVQIITYVVVVAKGFEATQLKVV